MVMIEITPKPSKISKTRLICEWNLMGVTRNGIPYYRTGCGVIKECPRGGDFCSRCGGKIREVK